MRPASIVNFERVVLLSIILGIVNTILIWDRLTAAMAVTGMGSNFVITVQAITVALYLVLIWFISRRASNVARWIYVVLAAIGLGFGLMGVGQVQALYGTIPLVITIAQYALAIASLWLLFRSDANAWFRGERPADPGVFS